MFFNVSLLKNFFLLVGMLSCFFSMKKINNAFLFEWSVGCLKKMFNFSLKMKIDWMSLLFFGILLIMVFSVNNFSFFYLASDVFFVRFFYILMGFVVSMVILIFVPSVMFLLVGWDGLGFTSFVLIIYYKTSNSWSSGLKTYLINRLGDGLLILAFVKLFKQGLWKIFILDKILFIFGSILFIFGCFTKSAQYPFCTWLPAAMAAPTPVSALVHSSTLVTAGMYLLMRFSPLLGFYENFFVGLVSMMTLFLASFSACVEWDLKKIMAFSTLSQLGLMCFSLSCGLVLFSFFHLLTHAVFKAMLFISAGYLLGQLNHLQDLRSLKKIIKFNPLMKFSLMMSVLALTGFPFLAGFFSKDIMMESNMFSFNFFFLSLFYFSLSLTSLYSMRVLYYLYYGKYLQNLKFSFLSKTKIFSVGMLILSSVFLGSLLKKNFTKFYFASTSSKFLVFFFMGLGVFLFLVHLKTEFNLSGSWMKKKIFFLESVNMFFLKKWSKVGSNIFSFDQNLNFFFMKKIKKSAIYVTTMFKIWKNFLLNFKKFMMFFTIVFSLTFLFIL